MKKLSVELTVYQMLWMGEACRSFLPDPRTVTDLTEAVTWWKVYEMYLKHWNRAVYEKEKYRVKLSASEALALYFFLVQIPDESIVMRSIVDRLDRYKVNLQHGILGN